MNEPGSSSSGGRKEGGDDEVVIVDPEFSVVMKKALEIAKKESGREFLVIDVEEKEYDVPGERYKPCQRSEASTRQRGRGTHSAG